LFTVGRAAGENDLGLQAVGFHGPDSGDGNGRAGALPRAVYYKPRRNS
jgi:hypothetical protein